jgi:hypothetical protein
LCPVPRLPQLFAAFVVVVGLLLAPGLVSKAGEADRPGAVAAAKTTYILCLNVAGTRYVLRYRPRRCAHFGPGGIFAGGVNLRRIRWAAWDQPSVRGRARECGFHLPCADIPVDIRAYSRRRACGRVVFTRLRATSRHGTTIVSLTRCPKRSF